MSIQRILAAAFLCVPLAVGCSDGPTGGDAGLDAGLVRPAVDLLLTDGPTRSCDHADVGFDVVDAAGRHVGGLAASAFSYSLLDVAMAAGRPVDNACPGETADGGIGSYRACVTGLTATSEYILLIRATAPAGMASVSFHLPVDPACALDASADAVTQDGSADATVLDGGTDVTPVTDAGADDAATLDAGDATTG